MKALELKLRRRAVAEVALASAMSLNPWAQVQAKTPCQAICFGFSSVPLFETRFSEANLIVNVSGRHLTPTLLRGA